MSIVPVRQPSRRLELLAFHALLALLACWALAAAAPAQETPLTTAAIEETVSAIEKRTDLDDAVKASVIETYRSAITLLEQAAAAHARGVEFEQAALGAPQTIAALEATLQNPPGEVAVEAPADATLQQLEGLLAEHEEEHKSAQAALADLISEQEERVRRRAALPKLLAAARERLPQIREQARLPAAAGEPQAAAAARATLLRAQQRATEEEIFSLEREESSYEARTDLIRLRRQEVERRVSRTESEVRAWREIVDGARRREVDEAKARVDEVRQQQDGAHPVLQAITEENARLADERARLAAKIHAEQERFDGLRHLLTRTREAFDSLDRKVNAMGLTTTVGVLLKTQEARLPSLRFHQRNIDRREDEIAAVEVWLVELDDRLRATLDDLADELLEDAEAPPEDFEDPELRKTIIDRLTESRRTFVTPLSTDFERYSIRLADVDDVERQLVRLLEKFQDYIERWILWTRSAPIYGAGEASRVWNSVRWFSSAESWNGLLRSHLEYGRTHAAPYVGLVLLLLTVLVAGAPLRRSIRVLAQQTESTHVNSIVPTLLALLVTCLLSLLAPVLLWYLAWLIDLPPETPELGRALASGLAFLGSTVLTLEILRQTCRSGGLAERHFGWNASCARQLRYRASSLLFLVGPTTFITRTLDAHAAEAHEESLGRLCFVIGILAFAIFATRVLRPSTGILYQAVRPSKDSLLYRLRRVLFVAAIAAVLALSLASLAGYHHTSLELAWRMEITLWVVFAALLTQGVAQRWFLLARRRFALKQARALQEAEHAEQGKESGIALSALAAPPVDLVKVNRQTSKLLNIAVAVTIVLLVWPIWNDVVPALGILKDVSLGWTKTVRVVDSLAADPVLGEAERTLQPLVEREVPVTLWDLFLAIGTAIFTVFGARNLPGLLQITLLGRLSLDSGVRHAIQSLSSYVIVLVGALIGFGLLGIGWSKVQWLAAALTVGLGFGLQEIFANFVAGVIILFEQPIRIGDVVTIADVSGTVTRIRIRATTITDWDRKEFLVPNKELITGRLLNWTLSDSTNRVVVNVGVAYGSDTDRARELLLEAAREEPLILAEPPPVATFEGFGDSSLMLVLRCFLPNLENRLLVISKLHTAIDRKLRSAGIEIPFPQRDLHLRSSDGLSSDGIVRFERAEEHSEISGET